MSATGVQVHSATLTMQKSDTTQGIFPRAGSPVNHTQTIRRCAKSYRTKRDGRTEWEKRKRAASLKAPHQAGEKGRMFPSLGCAGSRCTAGPGASVARYFGCRRPLNSANELNLSHGWGELYCPTAKNANICPLAA